jgi:hypothetical protein
LRTVQIDTVFAAESLALLGKSHTRTALAAELEVDSLKFALTGANAELARLQAEQTANHERDKLDRLKALCKEREGATADVEKAMRALATDDLFNDEVFHD